MHPLLDFLRQHHEQMLDDVREFVERETPSTDKGRLDDFAQFLCDFIKQRTEAATTSIVKSPDNGNHVLARWGDGLQGAPILLLGHFDTVWPAGTLADMPFAVRDGKATGPGIFDMKCGLVHGIWAVKAVQAVTGVRRPVMFLGNSDEEIGSPSSNALIRREAPKAGTVVVLEPSADGAAKTRRKGGGRFQISVTGRASHAGLDPYGGISAIDELARLILQLHASGDRETGTTVNVGTIRGGTRFNVVAAEAHADIDLRVATLAEAERMTQLIKSLKPHREEARVQVEGGMVWPPMERSARIVALFERAQKLAAELGFDLRETSVGGASDGCTCAALDLPVLDGMGAVGGGAHATHEHIDVASMPERAALVARLIETA